MRCLEPQQSRSEQIVTLGRLSMRAERDGVIHTISLFGELDLANADDVDEELACAESGDADVILVDLRDVTFIDSSGIRVLVRAAARSRADGNRLVLQGAPDCVLRVLRVTGVAQLLPLAG